MNLFIFIQGALSIGGAFYEFLRGNHKLAIVYAAWAVSNFAMSTVGSGK